MFAAGEHREVYRELPGSAHQWKMPSVSLTPYIHYAVGYILTPKYSHSLSELSATPLEPTHSLKLTPLKHPLYPFIINLFHTNLCHTLSELTPAAPDTTRTGTVCGIYQGYRESVDPRGAPHSPTLTCRDTMRPSLS